MKIGIYTMLFFMMGLVISGIIISSIWLDNETKSVDCFDKYGNKILNQVCLDEPLTEDEKFSVIILSFMFLILLTFTGIIMDEPLFGERY